MSEQLINFQAAIDRFPYLEQREDNLMATRPLSHEERHEVEEFLWHAMCDSPKKSPEYNAAQATQEAIKGMIAPAEKPADLATHTLASHLLIHQLMEENARLRQVNKELLEELNTIKTTMESAANDQKYNDENLAFENCR